MKELLEYITKRILPHPDDIKIEEKVDENGNVYLTLITHPDDTGLAIGKGGKTAHSLRELLKIKAMNSGVHVYLSVKSRDEIEEELEEKQNIEMANS